MVIIDMFLLQPHYFLPNKSPFWKKMSICVAILARNTGIYDCSLVLYPSKVNISSLSRFMNPWMGIIDYFLLQPHHFLSSKSPFWRKIEHLCGYFGSKDMYV